MRHHFTLATALLAILLTSQHLTASEPGLLARYSDGKHEVHLAVPTPNYALGVDQSIHPQIAPAFTAEWSGLLKIERGGDYTILADATVLVDGKPVQGKTVKLTPGEHPLKITAKRKAGPALLQLQWKSNFFRSEPIPGSAFRHAAKADKQIAAQSDIEQGRLLVEELNCTSCHTAGEKKLVGRRGPDLTEVAQRVNADWLFAWLANPKQHQPQAAMPTVALTDAQRADLVAALMQKARKVQKPDAEASAAKGKELFNSIGCVSCHGKKGISLAGVVNKYRSAKALAAFLLNPLHVDPSGRMPEMFDPASQADQAADVAAYLLSVSKLAPAKKLPAGGDVKRGQALLSTSGCAACHSVQVDNKDLPSKLTAPAFAKLGADKGCLAKAPAGAAPNYQLSADARRQLGAFVKSQQQHPDVAAAPVHAFYRRVQQMRCTACHELHHLGAGPARFVDDAGLVKQVERPPSLSDAGNKLRLARIQAVLTEKKRNRPWLRTRMPHFGEAVADLAPLLPASCGAAPETAPKPNSDLAKKGLEMIGVTRGGITCITCHNYRAINRQKSGVVPAPDLAEVRDTLRYEWFARWMQNPTRMKPGTSMPQFFVGKSHKEVDARSLELWSALQLQDKLPLPKGLVLSIRKSPPIPVEDQPVVFRAPTRLPGGLISRAINVGLPGGTNFAFDAMSGRLVAGWSGGFINPRAAWGGRGGNPVSIVGKVFYTAPKQVPIRLGDASKESTMRFRGYRLEAKLPIFLFDLNGVRVEQRITSGTEGGLVCEFSVAETPGDIYFVGDDKAVYASTDGRWTGATLKVSGKGPRKFKVTITKK